MYRYRNKKSKKRDKILLFFLIICLVILILLLFIDNIQDKKKEEELKVASEEVRKSEIVTTKQRNELNQIKRKIARKKRGDPNIIIIVNSIDRSLYDIVYPQMQKYGWQGIFVLTNGCIPGEKKDDITWDEYQELIQNGWDYAFSISTEASGEQQAEKVVNKAIKKWNEKGVDTPKIFVYEKSKIENLSEKFLKEKGFSFIVENTEKECEVAGDYNSTYSEFESVVLREAYSNVTNMMKMASADGSTLGITLFPIREEVGKEEQDKFLSENKFSIFISQIKEMEEMGYKINNYQEYNEVRIKNNKEVKMLEKKEEELKKQNGENQN